MTIQTRVLCCGHSSKLLCFSQWVWAKSTISNGSLKCGELSDNNFICVLDSSYFWMANGKTLLIIIVQELWKVSLWIDCVITGVFRVQDLPAECVHCLAGRLWSAVFRHCHYRNFVVNTISIVTDVSGIGYVCFMLLTCLLHSCPLFVGS